MAPRGTAIVGWWVTFPGTNTQPKRFVREEDARDYWPADTGDRKVLFRVWWNGIDGLVMRNKPIVVYRPDA